MINNQWYAVLSSGSIKKNKLLGVKRCGADLVFFRKSTGELACVQDLCAHRGASLAGGCVNSDHIKCPFHGIEYDESGRCVLVPSDGRSSLTDYTRFNLKHYTVREIGGVVFLWYGDGEPEGEPPVFDVMTDRGFRYSHLEDHWKVHYSRVIENQLDVSHLAFVHASTIGRGGKTLSNGPKTVWLDENTLQTSANNETDEGQIPKGAEECEIKKTNLTFKYPNLWLNTISDKIKILGFFIPVDEENSILAVRFYGKITGIGWIDSLIAWFGKWANRLIERQDKRVVETQLPGKTGLRMQENLVSADLPIIEYRSRREQLQMDQKEQKDAGDQR